MGFNHHLDRSNKSIHSKSVFDSHRITCNTSDLAAAVCGVGSILVVWIDDLFTRRCGRTYGCMNN